MSLQNNFTFHLVYDWVNLVIVSIFTAFHILRLQLNNNKERKRNSKLKLKELSYAILTCNIIALLKKTVLYTPAIYSSNHYLNSESCYYHGVFIICFTTFNKFLVHLFVVLRSRITDDKATIWFKIGM